MKIRVVGLHCIAAYWTFSVILHTNWSSWCLHVPFLVFAFTILHLKSSFQHCGSYRVAQPMKRGEHIWKCIHLCLHTGIEQVMQQRASEGKQTVVPDKNKRGGIYQSKCLQPRMDEVLVTRCVVLKF